MQQQSEETPKWLEELQQRSWEPEVLLSGIVLYGMFKTPPVLDKLAQFVKLNILYINDIDNIVGIFKLGIYWLIFGLILHLISRGIWVGMIGLSYTFPGGVNTDRLKLEGKFRKKVEALPSFQRIIITLEKVCSSLFSVSFMLFMSTLGAYMYLFVLVVAPFVLIVAITGSWNFAGLLIFQIYIFAVLTLGFVGFVDFLTLGFFRRFKWFARIYWPFHKVISILTLARFYRPIYYAFVSNFNRWIVGATLLVFTFVCFFAFGGLTDSGYAGDSISNLSFWHNTTGTSAYSGYYDDQNEAIYSVRAQIQSDIIDENVIRLFIPANILYEDSIRKFCNYDSLVKLDTTWAREERDLYVVQKFYHIYLDDSLLDTGNLFYHFKVRTDQRGYLSFIDIKSLPQGVHKLELDGPPSMFRRRLATIPFYRDISKVEDKETNSEPNRDDYLQVKPLLPK